MNTKGETRKRKTSTPPSGYVCKICNIEGHWIQQCPKKKKSKKLKTHIPVPGVDPSQKDIDLAREYQKMKPPNCFCGQPSRLKKVKRSSVNENSRAVGKYFFFCALKKSENPCRFARPVNEHRQRKHELPSKEEKPETVKDGNAERDENNPTMREKGTLESKDPDNPAHDDEAGTEISADKKLSNTMKSPPKVSDGSKSGESSSSSSNDESSDSSSEDSASSSDSSDEE